MPENSKAQVDKWWNMILEERSGSGKKMMLSNKCIFKFDAANPLRRVLLKILALHQTSSNNNVAMLLEMNCAVLLSRRRRPCDIPWEGEKPVITFAVTHPHRFNPNVTHHLFLLRSVTNYYGIDCSTPHLFLLQFRRIIIYVLILVKANRLHVNTSCNALSNFTDQDIGKVSSSRGRHFVVFGLHY